MPKTLIGRVLARLSDFPQATFSEIELRIWGGNAFDAARDQRLLRYVQPNIETATIFCSSPHCEGGSRSIAEAGGQLWALCNCPSLEAARRIERSDLNTWRLDIDELCSAFQSRNGLTGEAETLSDRLIYLGDTNRNGRSFSIVLGLLDRDHVRQHLTDLTRLGRDSDDNIVVLLYGSQPSRHLIHEFESQLIILAGLDEEEPLLIKPKVFGNPVVPSIHREQTQSGNADPAASMRKLLAGLSAGRKPGLGEAAFHLVRHGSYSNKQACVVLQEVFFPSSATVKAAKTLHEYEIPGLVRDGQRRLNRGYPCRFCRLA